jgi:hypothetical protein
MPEDRSQPSSAYAAALIAILALIALPFVLIELAVLEGKIFGTTRLTEIAQSIGIYEPLDALHDAIPWFFGS